MPGGKEKEKPARRILRVLAALAYYLTPTYAQWFESCHGRPFRRDPRPSDRFSLGRRLLIYGHYTASCRTTLTTHSITRVSHGSVPSFSLFLSLFRSTINGEMRNPTEKEGEKLIK